jgi:hypothetical protein
MMPDCAAQPPYPIRLMLVGRAWCHLCEDMEQALRPLLARYGATLAILDADQDPALEAAYDEIVPVLLLETPVGPQEICHYHLDASALHAAILRINTNTIQSPQP